MTTITATDQEIDLLEQMSPGEDEVHGTAYLPREFEPSMFEILQWKYSGHPSDFKKSSTLVRDKVQKSSNQWVSESKDNFRGFVYSPKKKKLYSNYLQDNMQQSLNFKTYHKDDEDMYLTEYGRAFLREKEEEPKNKTETEKTTKKPETKKSQIKMRSGKKEEKKRILFTKEASHIAKKEESKVTKKDKKRVEEKFISQPRTVKIKEKKNTDVRKPETPKNVEKTEPIKPVNKTSKRTKEGPIKKTVFSNQRKKS